MNLEEENKISLSRCAFPELYLYANSFPSDVFTLRFENGILVECKIKKPEVKIDIKELIIYEEAI